MSWLSRTYRSRLPSELRRRIASAALLAPVVLGLIALGGFYFFILCAAAAAVVLVEWNAIASRGKPGFASSCAILTLIGSAFLLDKNEPLWAVAALAAGCVGVALIATRRPRPEPLWAVLGLLYAAIIPFAGIALRSDPSLGWVAIVWLLMVVWASDTGAYAVGRAIGGPKLWPRVSPGKTWAGLIGGLTAAVLIGAGISKLALGMSFLGGAFLGGAFGLVAQVGDLLESAFKRRFSVRETSHLIPGHGGLMDRIDSLIAALAVAALLGVMRGKSAAEGLLLW